MSLCKNCLEMCKKQFQQYFIQEIQVLPWVHCHHNEPEERPMKCNCDIGIKGYTIYEDWKHCPIHKNMFVVVKPKEKPEEKCWCDNNKYHCIYNYNGWLQMTAIFCPKCGKKLN